MGSICPVVNSCIRVREEGAAEWTDVTGAVADGQFTGTAAGLGLAVHVELRSARDRIEINGAIRDLRAAERSVELMCVLPARTQHVRWHLDIEETTDPYRAAAPTAVADTTGAYRLWIDAHDFDPGTGCVSVIGPDGQERVIAILAPPGTSAAVDRKWHTFGFPGT